jgi:hypothetical protein
MFNQTVIKLIYVASVISFEILAIGLVVLGWNVFFTKEFNTFLFGVDKLSLGRGIMFIVILQWVANHCSISVVSNLLNIFKKQKEE